MAGAGGAAPNACKTHSCVVERFLPAICRRESHPGERNPATISVARRKVLSISVGNHNDPVKTKVVICASLMLADALSSAEAGPSARGRFGGSVCFPARPVCRSVAVFSPAVCRAWPVYFYPASYGWSSFPIVSSTSFSNVSPVLDHGDSGIYRVPAPGVPAADRQFGGKHVWLAALISPAEARPSLEFANPRKAASFLARGRVLPLFLKSRSTRPRTSPLTKWPESRIKGASSRPGQIW